MPTQQQRPNARLAQLRRERGWTQDDVARRIAADTRQRTGKTVPINADYVSRLERGLIGRPRSDYREAFRNLFGTTDADLGFAPRPTGPSRPGAAPVDRRRLFQLPPGIPDFIGRSAAVDTLIERVGVCRDFAHLMIALCRALNIPARFATGIDYGADPALGPTDFHAYVEVYLGDHWYIFDPSGTAIPMGFVRFGTGRDAADAAFATIFGGVQSPPLPPRLRIEALTGTPDLTLPVHCTQALSTDDGPPVRG